MKPPGTAGNAGGAAEVAWRQLPADEVVQLLEADLQAGLSSERVRERQRRYGPNRLTFKKAAARGYDSSCSSTRRCSTSCSSRR